MSKFIAVRTVKLDFLEPSDMWKDCYLQINSLTLGEIEKMASFKQEDSETAGKYLVKLIEDKFIGGKGWNGKEIVEIKKEDVKDLPVDVFEGLFVKLTAGLPKKK